MEKLTLTPQIAGNYIGCKIQTTEGIGILEGVHKQKSYVSFDDGQPGRMGSFPISDCQLILTPLAKISDEDAVEVCKFLYTNPALCNPERGKIVATVGEWHSTRRGVEIIDFLRSRGYDCGHSSIPSLIQAGIAVDGTLLTDKK